MSSPGLSGTSGSTSGSTCPDLRFLAERRPGATSVSTDTHSCKPVGCLARIRSVAASDDHAVELGPGVLVLAIAAHAAWPPAGIAD